MPNMGLYETQPNGRPISGEEAERILAERKAEYDREMAKPEWRQYLGVTVFIWILFLSFVLTFGFLAYELVLPVVYEVFFQ